MRIPSNTLESRLSTGVAALVAMVALGAPARAVVIQVDGVDWTISATEVRAGTGVDTFRSTYITSQPWNGSVATASRFAEALGGRLSFPNENSAVSPFFAYAALTDPQDPGLATYRAAGALASGGIYDAFQPASTDTYTYATATRANTGVPGPLPLLGGMAAFGWSRRMRRRVFLSPRP